MKVIQRFPNYFSNFKPEEKEVFSLAEINEIPFVRRWISSEGFYRLSIGRSDKNQAILMCELDEGKQFWAIAWLTDHQGFDLPSWR